MRALISFVLFIAVACDASGDETSLQTTIETATAPYRSKRPFAALSVGVIQNGKHHTFSFGHTGEGDAKRPADSRTLFEIGSCTKVFTSLSLAVLIQRGDVKLDDPISRLLPDAKLSDDAGRITLHELSTHTSGLPRLPVAMLFDSLWHRYNPYVAFDARRLEHFLQTWKAPEKRPFMYSNLGAGLLGHALQQKAGAASYEALIAATITQPLKLSDTTATLSDEQRSRYAAGFTVKGAPVASWDFKALAGAGALRSTTDDLLTFLEHQLNPEKSPLRAAIELSQQTRKSIDKIHIGLGWLIIEKEGRTLIFHNGATGGYTAFMGFEPATKNGVVLLSNTADAYAQDQSLDRLGFDLLTKKLFTATEAAPSPEKP